MFVGVWVGGLGGGGGGRGTQKMCHRTVDFRYDIRGVWITNMHVFLHVLSSRYR